MKKRCEMSPEELEQTRANERMYQKRRRIYMMKLHKCIRCGAMDERTEAGKSHCAKCTLYFKMWNIKRRAGK